MNLLKNITKTLLIGMAMVSSCSKPTGPLSDVNDGVGEISQQKIDFLGITDPNHLSAASKRALAWPDSLTNDWFGEFTIQDLKGDLAYEEGVVRRDPSALLNIDGKYYVYYSKSVGKTDGFGGDIENDKVFPWDRCDIWYATSKDGWTWKEEGPAVIRGDKGKFDDRSVFTPEVMEYEGKFYLCYQTIKSPYNVRTKNQVGLAYSDSPNGPWTKLDSPILSPANNGIWKGTEQNRFLVEKKGDFDSHKVHDPCIIPYNGKFYLYYKGEQMGEAVTFGGRQIRHGVAIADNPLGPYVKSPYNPISNSGHEICVFKHKDGIISMITTDGAEKGTVQYANDGINFNILASIPGAPHAMGLNRSLNSDEPFSIFEWGLTHKYVSYDYQHIQRFAGRRKTSHTAKNEQSSKQPKSTR